MLITRFEDQINRFKTLGNRGMWDHDTISMVHKDCGLGGVTPRYSENLVLSVIDGFLANSDKPPTPYMFRMELVRVDLERKKNLREEARPDCGVCDNGLVVVVEYTDLDRYEWLLPASPVPKWFEQSQSDRRFRRTLTQRCSCGRNNNPKIQGIFDATKR